MLRHSGQRRILTKRKQLQSAPLALHSPVKETRRKQWTNKQMEDAMEEARSCKTGINEAARMYNVPPTILKDRISGKVKHHRTKPGPKKYLNDVEEEELAMFLIDTSAMGYGKSGKDVMGIAEDYARSKNMLRKPKITHGWCKNRQSDLLLRRCTCSLCTPLVRVPGTLRAWA